MADIDIIRAAILAEIERRGDKAPTITDLAQRSEMSRPNLSAWLAGRATVTTETASRVLEALGLGVRRSRRADG